MCWVIPPASVSTTLALRIASRSVVLPWSTWPMIVTTGGRGTRSAGSSSIASGSSSSSSACLIVISRFSSAARSSTSSSVSDCVAVFRAPRAMSILIRSCIPTPSACENSRTVMPDGTVTGPVGRTISFGCFGTAGPPRWSRGPRPSGRGRAAPVSMTTRRLRPGPPPWRGLIGLFGPSAMVFSVERAQRRIDSHALPEHPRERVVRGRALEAREPPAGVDATPRACAPRSALRCAP